MTDNTIRARLAFSFKAETYELDAVIDLDRQRRESEEVPNFHQLLAKAGDIDTYSYLYEAMESYEVEFSDPTGVAVQCCRDGEFDWSRFVNLCREERDLERVRSIAARVMGVQDLDDMAKLKSALLAAYRAGQADFRR